MSGETYTQRHINEGEITSLDPFKSTLWFDNPPPDELLPKLCVGDRIAAESKGSKITGWLHNGDWFSRKSDQDLEREHAEFCADLERRHERALERNRADWERRTAALPEWLQDRIRHFINKGGKNFALNGWGYELIICELAVLYFASNLEDSDDVSNFAREQGTSGNQHDMAKALARAHSEGFDLAGTVSALSPITGDADYSNRSER